MEKENEGKGVNHAMGWFNAGEEVETTNSIQDISRFVDLLFVEEEGQLVMSLQSFFILYLVVLVLCFVVYKLGFARKLPPLKAAVVYLFLVIGALPISFLGIALPIVEGLVIAAIFLGIVRWRMGSVNKDSEQKQGDQA